MKATELRIGNLVESSYMMKKWEETIISLNHLSFLEDGVHHFVRLKPIPLTEQWLEKFGLCENNEYHHYLTFTGKKIHYCVDSFNDEWIEIKYVHQLQNLYHSLTGEELKVKELV